VARPTRTSTSRPSISNPRIAFTVAGTPVFGGSLDVSWTVQNIGTDPAKETWRDRIWLSTDGILDGNDRLLHTELVSVAPLAVNGTYEKTATVALPLSTSLPAGFYYLILQADALGTQPETNENNNTAVSAEALQIGLPPLPDLIVSDIEIPVEALSGQQVPITWTLTNQGTGTASGTWQDYVYFSLPNPLHETLPGRPPAQAAMAAAAAIAGHFVDVREMLN